MRHAENSWRLVRLLIVAACTALAGCISTGGEDLVSEAGISYRKVMRIDRSGPPEQTAGLQYASHTYGERLRVPEMRVIHAPQSRAGTRNTAGAARHVRGGATMQAPVSGGIVISHFGVRDHPILGGRRLHSGIDLAAPAGTPIRAAADGTIDFAGWNGGYGNLVRIRHDGRYSTAYAHMRGFADGLEPGTAVRRGEVIGYVGSTGQSTGPHLHFELLDGGQPIDPLEILPMETVVALASG